MCGRCRTRLAEVVEEPNGNLKVARGGHTPVLHPSRDKDVAEVQELMKIRHRSRLIEVLVGPIEANGREMICRHQNRKARSEPSFTP